MCLQAQALEWKHLDMNSNKSFCRGEKLIYCSKNALRDTQKIKGTLKRVPIHWELGRDFMWEMTTEFNLDDIDWNYSSCTWDRIYFKQDGNLCDNN